MSPGFATVHMSRFPVDDVVEEQIKPFVKMNGGESNDEILENVKYEFHCHEHKLSLISSSSSSSSSSELICDGCITPINPWKHEYYMSCSECKYHLHRECFNLPPQLPSLPFHVNRKLGHDLILKSCSHDKLEFRRKSCCVCGRHMNGLFYVCQICSTVKADIKCATLLDPVHHSAHRQHPLNYLTSWEMRGSYYYSRRLCDAGCGLEADELDCYVCGKCDDFVVHVRCAALPSSIENRRWDEHPLVLTYDAGVKHPNTDFFCDHCEEEIDRKKWMYDCRRCNSSFHPGCLSLVSGVYRNIKFGQKYMVATVHPHPLTYHLLTVKRRCDGCGREQYGKRGFQCESCYFFICLNKCVDYKMIREGRIQIVSDD